MIDAGEQLKIKSFDHLKPHEAKVSLNVFIQIFFNRKNCFDGEYTEFASTLLRGWGKN